MKCQIPGQGELEIKTIILDLNGTLSVGGQIVEGVHGRTKKLKELGFTVILFTGNTRGDADDIAKELNIEWMQASGAAQKRELAEKLEPETCVSIGNGLIDLQLMEAVALGIVTLQAEGVHRKTLLACDLMVPTINDALDLFIDQDRLVASLRS
jgi:soluble P-type ATPase